MGIEVPKIEVRYENLSVEGDVRSASRALPTLFNVTLNTIEVQFFFFFIGLTLSCSMLLRRSKKDKT